jgi:small-conductance mechanosensitive channel
VPDLSHLLNTTLFTRFALAAAAALLAWLLMRVGLRFAIARLRSFSERTRTLADDTAVEVLDGTSPWLLLLTAALIGVNFLQLGERWDARVGQLWFITIALQAGLWLARASAIGLRRYQARHYGGAAAQQQISASATLVSWFVHTVIWSIVLLAILSNLGVDITAFIASLGVGGIAVALAVQNILGDVFASVSIAVDKPFEVGDFIVVGDVSGNVEHVGVKTTRIRSIDGEQIIIGNTDLLKQVVKNYKRMTQRRVVFRFGLSYDTTQQQAQQVPAMVRRLVESDENLRFDRAHLANLGESSIDYEVVYIVKDRDYNRYMDAHQRLMLALMREIAACGAQFAFPSRTVYLVPAPQSPDAGAVAVAPPPQPAGPPP